MFFTTLPLLNLNRSLYNTNFLNYSDPAFTCPGAGACSSIDQFGVVSNIAFGNFSGLGGVFEVGTFEFTSLQAGISDLIAAETMGSAGPFVSAFTFDVMDVDFNSASVQAVPVPAALWLFASALGFLGFTRRIKK